MVTPTPTEQLAKLLEDQKVEYAACCHFAVIIARYLVPVKPIDSFGKRDDQGDGQGVGVAKDLKTSKVRCLHELLFSRA